MKEAVIDISGIHRLPQAPLSRRAAAQLAGVVLLLVVLFGSFYQIGSD